MSPILPVRGNSWPRLTRSTHNSRPTMLSRWPPSTPWPAATITPANTNSSACMAWANLFTRRWSAAASSTGRAGFTHRSAPTKRCSPIWCAGFWKMAPTHPSSTASRIRRLRSMTSWPTRSRPQPRSDRSERNTRGLPFRAIFMARSAKIPPGLIFATNTCSRPSPRVCRRTQPWSIAPCRSSATNLQAADAILIDRAFAIAVDNAARWAATPPPQRAALLDRAAALMQARMAGLIGVIVREAGKSLPNAVGEVREAIDFLRYYAAQIRERFSNDTHRPLGPVVCISPWNFPRAIFTGQIAAALAAGNPVLAKPAEETPLIASLAVAILREAGVPSGVSRLLPGDGKVGAALVGDARARGVMFTGSTEVARLIQAELAKRTNPDGKPVPLIAETGGQNALIVDSSALAEQVVGDLIQSAFDSAGQRCSAVRVLCLQEEVADHILTMLKGALREIAIGNPDRLAIDVGPVITAEEKATILDHVEVMRSSGHVVEQMPLPEESRHGTFVPPTLIEIGALAELKREVFGPVLHVLRFRRDGLDRLLDDINATGYALTFGLHTRIDETVDQV